MSGSVQDWDPEDVTVPLSFSHRFVRHRVLITRLLHSMECDGIKRGVVTLRISGGQAIALALGCV